MIRGVKASASLKPWPGGPAAGDAATDPRCKSLGLIEAPKPWRDISMKISSIRGVKASASLKQNAHVFIDECKT